jgi:hypothetical protein
VPNRVAIIGVLMNGLIGRSKDQKVESLDRRKSRETVYPRVLNLFLWVRAAANEIAGTEGDFDERLTAPSLTDEQRAHVEADVTVFASEAVKDQLRAPHGDVRVEQSLHWHQQDVRDFASIESAERLDEVSGYAVGQIQDYRTEIRRVAKRITETIRAELHG